MQDPKRTIAAINKLLSQFHTGTSADPATLLRGYIESVEDFENDDIDAGVTLLIKAKVPSFDGRYAPSPTQFAAAARMAMDQRLDSANRIAALHPALPPPDVFKDDDSRARVLALKAEVLANLAGPFAADTEAKVKAKKEWQEKLDRRFEPDMSSRALAERLGLIDRGYDVGDPEGDEDAA